MCAALGAQSATWWHGIYVCLNLPRPGSACRFESNLLFNLGLVGPDLWDTSRPVPEPNVTSALDRPIVVYDIDASGQTVYPPTKVVEPDGKERPLNRQESTFQVCVCAFCVGGVVTNTGRGCA